MTMYMKLEKDVVFVGKVVTFYVYNNFKVEKVENAASSLEQR